MEKFIRFRLEINMVNRSRMNPLSGRREQPTLTDIVIKFENVELIFKKMSQELFYDYANSGWDAIRGRIIADPRIVLDSDSNVFNDGIFLFRCIDASDIWFSTHGISDISSAERAEVRERIKAIPEQILSAIYEYSAQNALTEEQTRQLIREIFDHRCEKGTALVHYAAKYNNVNCLDFLVRHIGPEVLRARTIDGCNVLHCTTNNNCLDAIRFIMKHVSLDILEESSKMFPVITCWAERWDYCSRVAQYFRKQEQVLHLSREGQLVEDCRRGLNDELSLPSLVLGVIQQQSEVLCYRLRQLIVL